MSCDDFALQKVSLLWVGVPWRICGWVSLLAGGCPLALALALVGVPNDRSSGCPQRPSNDRSNDRSQRPRWVSGCYPPLLPQ